MRWTSFFLTACYCSAQSFSFGVIGGVRATGDMNSPAVSESKRYTVGPMAGIGLPFGFGIEVDALYSREGFRAANSTPLATTNLNSHANEWQVPILLTHSVPFPVVKPFVEIGYSPRFINGTLDRSGEFLSSPTTFQPFDTRTSTDWAASHGLVIGGGVKLHVGSLRLAPQVRYTHWNNAPIAFSFADGPSFSNSQDEVNVLLGIGWKVAGR